MAAVADVNKKGGGCLMQLVAIGCHGLTYDLSWSRGHGATGGEYPKHDPDARFVPANRRDSCMHWFVDRDDGMPEACDLAHDHVGMFIDDAIWGPEVNGALSDRKGVVRAL